MVSLCMTSPYIQRSVYTGLISKCIPLSRSTPTTLVMPVSIVYVYFNYFTFVFALRRHEVEVGMGRKAGLRAAGAARQRVCRAFAVRATRVAVIWGNNTSLLCLVGMRDRKKGFIIVIIREQRIKGGFKRCFTIILNHYGYDLIWVAWDCHDGMM